MTQQEKQINYVGPFITMVFLFLIVGFLTTANTQFQGPLRETFLANVGDLKNTFATLITFSWFLAYPLSGGIGSLWTTKHGYKGTLIRSLFIMIGGARTLLPLLLVYCTVSECERIFWFQLRALRLLHLSVGIICSGSISNHITSSY